MNFFVVFLIIYLVLAIYLYIKYDGWNLFESPTLGNKVFVILAAPLIHIFLNGRGV